MSNTNLNSKALNYFLVLAVLVLWGIIMYRLFSTKEVDKEAGARVMVDVVTLKTSEPVQYELIKTEDPFRLNKKQTRRVTSIAPIKELKEKVLPREKKQKTWPTVKFDGTIKNKNSNDLISLIVVNGYSWLASEGMKMNGLQLVEQFIDSVQISYEGENRVFKKNKGE